MIKAVWTRSCDRCSGVFEERTFQPGEVVPEVESKGLVVVETSGVYDSDERATEVLHAFEDLCPDCLTFTAELLAQLVCDDAAPKKARKPRKKRKKKAPEPPPVVEEYSEDELDATPAASEEAVEESAEYQVDPAESHEADSDEPEEVDPDTGDAVDPDALPETVNLADAGSRRAKAAAAMMEAQSVPLESPSEGSESDTSAQSEEPASPDQESAKPLRSPDDGMTLNGTSLGENHPF